jgi:hypothetical protein
MSAMADNVVSFEIPKLPKLKLQDAPPDGRKVAVLPIRAGSDRRLHGGTLRTLIVLCSYCNRAGLTWVGQERLAQDLGVSRQAVGKQLALLQATGYVQVHRKGYRKEYANTLRVIFDESIDMETAIAITSAQEDTRPPAMQNIDPVGQARVASIVNQVFTKDTKEKTMSTRKKTKTQPPEVAPKPVDKVLTNSDIGNLQRLRREQLPEVALTKEEDMRGLPVIRSSLVTSKLLKEKEADMLVLSNLEVNELKSDGMTTKQIADSIDTLMALYKAEGITPTSKALMDGIRQLKADTR